MAQAALFVEGLVGVGHVDPLIHQSSNQRLGGGSVSGVFEHLVPRLIPNIGAGYTLAPVEGSALHLVVGHDAEGRDDIGLEILVLVVAPDDHEVGLKFVEFLPQFAEAPDQPLSGFFRRTQTLVLAELDAHGFGPVGGDFHLVGDARVAQAAVNGIIHQFVGGNQRWRMGESQP